ncbi:hypothetical protein BDFB_001306 [Asbolus verrucosus]|uniref:Uncharacterized protein n=1 Tax=Asbolus verrucosus TaxID=1661398 RepID=A0A482VGD8_ASBVE|nr:hypothetical protein BDFB_001306 [Asbolus verrucosus]
MTSAEKGGQWLLSSYAPFKEKPAFPGFEDHSMEEIRYLFYESARNGTIEQYKQNLQLMLQQAVMKIKALQNPSPDAVNMLKSIYNTIPSSSFNNNQFNAAPTNPLFSHPPQQQQKSVFANPASNQNVFSGANAPPNVFAPAPQMQQNVFAAPNTNPTFADGQNNVFVNQQAAKSVFASPQQVPSNNTVYASNSVFSGGAQPVFVHQQQPPVPFQQSSPFNQQQQAQFTAQQQNIFHQNQFGVLPNSNNQFGVTQPPNNQYGVPTSQPLTDGKPSFQHTANIFGNLATQPANPNIFGGAAAQTKPNENFYSKLEELSEQDVKWFQSDDLDVSKIPEKPPTYEMCFKL